MVDIDGIAASYVAVTFELCPPVPPFELNDTVYLFGVHTADRVSCFVLLYVGIYSFVKSLIVVPSSFFQPARVYPGFFNSSGRSLLSYRKMPLTLYSAVILSEVLVNVYL